MLQEINEIPKAAERCYEKNINIELPLNVPYLGMGSSYFALLAIKYQGINIQCELASEYYNFLSGNKKVPLGVLISQSGSSSEVLWCKELFDEYISIVNYENTELSKSNRLKKELLILAGTENHSATKSYINTLITLYKGFGIEVKEAIKVLTKKQKEYNEWGESIAEKIYSLTQTNKMKAIYIIGSGVNISTINQAALILTECTKLPVIALPTAQYDHGPKESAKNSVVIGVNNNGTDKKRIENILKTVRGAGATTFECLEDSVEENLSPITSIVPFNYLAYYLQNRLGIKEIFSVGGKVTIVKN